jgi:hypothetical protein
MTITWTIRGKRSLAIESEIAKGALAAAIGEFLIANSFARSSAELPNVLVAVRGVLSNFSSDLRLS